MRSSRTPNSTRARKARSVERPSTSMPDPQVPGIDAEMADIRLRLALAMAVAYITSAALKARHADSDRDAAFVLQRHVGDALDVQIERLDFLAARCSEQQP
jgi:hypothetical protein